MDSNFCISRLAAFALGVSARRGREIVAGRVLKGQLPTKAGKLPSGARPRVRRRLLQAEFCLRAHIYCDGITCVKTLSHCDAWGGSQ